jgi:putative transposase
VKYGVGSCASGKEAVRKPTVTEDESLHALEQADAGDPVGDVYRQMGISEATLYVWRKR